MISWLQNIVVCCFALFGACMVYYGAERVYTTKTQIDKHHFADKQKCFIRFLTFLGVFFILGVGICYNISSFEFLGLAIAYVSAELTDVQYKLIDRHSLRYALCCAIMGYIIRQEPIDLLLVYAIFYIITMLFINLGASDIRCIFIGFLACWTMNNIVFSIIIIAVHSFVAIMQYIALRKARKLYGGKPSVPIGHYIMRGYIVGYALEPVLYNILSL